MNIFCAFLLFFVSQLCFAMHEPKNVTELANLISLSSEDRQELDEAVTILFGDDIKDLFSLFAHFTEENAVSIRKLVSQRAKEQKRLGNHNRFYLLSAVSIIEAALRDYEYKYKNLLLTYIDVVI